MENHYNLEDVEALIDKTKEKLSRAKDGEGLGSKLATTMRMTLPISFEGPIAVISNENGGDFKGI